MEKGGFLKKKKKKSFSLLPINSSPYFLPTSDLIFISQPWFLHPIWE